MAKIKTQNENTDLQLHHILMFVAISAFKHENKMNSYVQNRQAEFFLQCGTQLKDGTMSNQKEH